MTVGASARSVMLMLSVLAGSRVGAQPAAERIGAPIRGNDFASYRFPRASGLTSGTVYAVARDGRGRLWLGTEDGAFSSQGGQWRTEALPPGATNPQVRRILFDSGGGRWFAMRNGAFRYANGKWTKYGSEVGVPGPVVYSITETRAINSGTTDIVIGASDGICVVDALRCRAMAVPPGIGANAFMVRSAEAVDGVSELWAVSASGGAARYRLGKWTTFGGAEGLTTASAEDLVLTPSANGMEVYVVGLAGVFALRRTPNNGERFALIPGSPRSVYRAAFVKRTNQPDELWFGTGDGFVMRWRASAWDTLRVEGDQVRGQITLIYPNDDEDTREVYLGSRGDRLTRLSFSSAILLNLPGRASREWVTGILQHADPRYAGQAIIATSAAGATLVDTLANTRLLNDPTNPLLVSTSVGYWGWIPSSTSHGDNPSVLSELIIIGHRGPVWFPHGEAELMPVGAGVVMRRMRELQLPGIGRALVGASTKGFMQWTGSAWVLIPSLPQIDATDVFQTQSRDSVTEFATALGGVYTITTAGFTFDSVPHVELSGPPWLRWICEVNTADGPILFVAGDRGTFAWRPRDDRGKWRSLPRQFRRAINTTKQATVECGKDGQVFFGSANGVLIGDVTGHNMSTWAIRAMIGRDNGLPSSEVTVVSKPFNGRVWVGTEYGVAMVEVDHAALRPLLPLSVRLSEYPSGREVADGEILKSTSDQLRVDAWLDSQARENESLYDIEWKRDAAWWGRERAVDSDSGWTSSSTRYITNINPGRYQLRVRARDFAGRETPALEWHVVVLSPWWESWAALFAYGLLVLATLWALYRWRIGVIQRGTAGLIKSERRLQVSERKFRALFDRAQDSHMLVEDGRIVSANRVAASLFGIDDPAVLVGQLPADVLPAPTVSDDDAAVRDVMVKRGADSVPVQVTTTSIDTGDGVLEHLVIKDLTEVRNSERARERIESHLRERQRLEALGTLAGGIAHDFNNLLGVIRGNAQLAEASVHDAALTTEHLVSIVDASDRARDLVRQILAFSQSPLPKQELVDLSAVLQSLQPLLRRMIPSSVSIELEGVDEPHIIEGDTTQLQQVLLNLASNAEYAMRQTGSGELVMVLCDDVSPREGPLPVGRIVRLSVRDTGEGMTPDLLERVFEPFFTTKPTGEGTGLGLSVLHGVVQAHGGRVRIESALHVGTTVEITFPAAQGHLATDEGKDERAMADVHVPLKPGPARAATTPLSARSQRRYPGARLIVVDDEPQVGRVMEKALTRFGYVVRVFHRPDDALRAIMDDVDAVDLVLTDQTMPGMTGDILSAEVHRMDAGLPVLILTGFSHTLTPERVVEVGAIGVLQKPIDLETLDLAVENALAASAANGRRSWV